MRSPFKWLRPTWRIGRYLLFLLGLASAISFAQFIVEEAIQQVGFACWRWAELGEGLALFECGSKMEKMSWFLDDFSRYIGWLNPLFYRSYQLFAESTLHASRAYKLQGQKLLQGCKPDRKTRLWICPDQPQGQKSE